MSFPSSPVPSSVKLSGGANTLISIAHSGKRQARSRGGHKWRIGLTWAPMTLVQFMPIWAFVQAQLGQFGTFTIVLPLPYVAQGSWGGTPLVKGASQTGGSIVIDGVPPGITGVVKAGDLIKFADSKVYMITADANSNGSGEVTLSIMPNLMSSPADNEAVTYSSVPFTMALAGDLQEHSVQPPSLFTFSQDLIEVY